MVFLFTAGAGYLFTMATAEYWQCVCKAFNAVNVEKCPACGHDPSTRQIQWAEDGCDSERSLHDEIEAYCRERQWPYVHSRMDMPTTTQRGIADFLVLLPNGKLLIAEAKTKHGKQTPEQLGWQIMCERVGHKYHVVRSIEQFKALSAVLNSQT